MPDSLQINRSELRLAKGDITDMEIEAFVFYARHDLQLGSGFGNAIAQRGGPSIQEELAELGSLETTQVAITGAGNLKNRFIIHAVGPRFMEQDLSDKLRATVRNCLEQAEQKGIKSVAFPPMGAGFYGVPLDVSARITLETIRDHLADGSQIEDVVVCLFDKREYDPFAKQLANLQGATATA